MFDLQPYQQKRVFILTTQTFSNSMIDMHHKYDDDQCNSSCQYLRKSKLISNKIRISFCEGDDTMAGCSEEKAPCDAAHSTSTPHGQIVLMHLKISTSRLYLNVHIWSQILRRSILHDDANQLSIKCVHEHADQQIDSSS